MGKIIFWVVVIIGGLLLARLLAHQKANAARPKQAPPRAMPPARPGESMIRCEHCGIHLPRSDAVLIGGRTWCSQEHARVGMKK